MKKKIHFQLMAITTVAIFATVFFISVVFYELYREQIVEDLRTYAELLEDTEFVYHMEGLPESGPFRTTLIDQNGEVLYDSNADNDIMDNHSSRPEVLNALQTGEGVSVRRSATMEKSTFYYARLLKDGGVLRIAREAGSIWSIFYRAMPVVVVIVLILLGLCAVMSRFLTQRLLAPISQLAENLDRTDEITAYEELQPFLNMIQAQHEDIMKNALIRQEFTANVSHELKTPLTSISGYAELIETGMASDEDVRRFAAGIHKNAKRLLTLINDIIRLSELDGSEEETPRESVNLYLAARTCVDMLQLSAEKHHVTLQLAGKPCFVNGDRQMVDELLYNLCDNAIRYNNENGSVLVQTKRGEKGTELLVKDTGIGIPKEAQERVFERFYRVDKSRSKSTGGTGLGLAIVKHIIAKMGAEIRVRSEVGEGTEITVLFPQV